MRDTIGNTHSFRTVLCMGVMILCLLLSACGRGAEKTFRYQLSAENAELTVGEMTRLDLFKNDSILAEGVLWSSDNEDVAAVDDMGHVTAVSKGETVIRAVYGGQDYNCFVTVSTKPGLNHGEITLMKGTDRELLFLVNDEPVFDDVEWISLDENVVSVLNGQLHANGVGDTTVKAVYRDQSYVCDVEVFDVFDLAGDYFCEYYVEEIDIRFTFDIRITPDGHFVYSRRAAQSADMDIEAEIIREGSARMEGASGILSFDGGSIRFTVEGKNTMTSEGEIVVSNEMKDMMVQLTFSRVLVD